MTETNQVIKENELLFNEAPASWNSRYIDPTGFECQITLRGETGLELLEKANSAITYLLNAGCQPSTFNRNSYRNNTPNGAQEPKNGNGNGNNGHKEIPSWCPIHQCEMKRWDKEGRTWYSHKFNGEWCRGK
jgi:hypothetical protein